MKEMMRRLFDIHESEIFFLLSMPYLLILVFLTPPFQVPDEPEHYFYARAITTGHIFPRDLDGTGVGGTVTQADIELVTAFDGIKFHPEVKATRQMYEAARQVEGANTWVVQNYWGAAIYPPVAYAIPAVAMLLADAAGFDRLDAFYAGRAANALLFALSVALAIWITPVGKAAFAAIFLLPMSLFEAASFSADAPTYALTALICAIMMRLATSTPDGTRTLWLVGILIAVLSTIKSPLVALIIPLAALALRNSKKTALFLVSLVASVWLAWTVGFMSMDGFAARQKTLVDVSSSEQIRYILGNPFVIFEISLTTIRLWWWDYVSSGIGILGWLDTGLSRLFYIFSIIVLIFVFIGSVSANRVELPKFFRWSLFASAISASALIFGALYLTWTPVGFTSVQGVQGRYFIPILLIMAISVSNMNASRYSRSISAATYGVIFLFATISLAHVTSVLVDRYYVP